LTDQGAVAAGLPRRHEIAPRVTPDFTLDPAFLSVLTGAGQTLLALVLVAMDLCAESLADRRAAFEIFIGYGARLAEGGGAGVRWHRREECGPALPARQAGDAEVQIVEVDRCCGGMTASMSSTCC
jgi:hypothetical protein